jgi:hypothetical protein
LIEDNAHGHSGQKDGKLLGTFGDMGFSSPRKHLGCASGGVLYLNGHIKSAPQELVKLPVNWKKALFQQSFTRFPTMKARLRNILRNRPEYTNPLYFNEIGVSQNRADDKSTQIIHGLNWNNFAEKQRIIWSIWSLFAVENDLTPLWDNTHPDSCPWALPVYVKNKEERLHWLNWGWVKGFDVFSWPTLPQSVITSSPIALDRWNHFLCFSLNRMPI